MAITLRRYTPKKEERAFKSKTGCPNCGHHKMFERRTPLSMFSFKCTKCGHKVL